MLTLLKRDRSLSDEAYVELVGSLYGSLLPAAVMSALFVGVATLSLWATDDVALLLLGVVGATFSALRVGLIITGRRQLGRQVVDRQRAASYERQFAICHTAFAAVLGLFGARVIASSEFGLHMIVVALLVGYAAGVAATVSLRPWIGGTSMLLAVAPAIVVCCVSMQIFHVALAVVLCALLVGGLQSMMLRYLTEVSQIELRRTISGLARQDPLTGLPNRLGLTECFEEAVADHDADCLIAVHCLDLDRFKPVNDRYGHPVGDELLRMVADRLLGGLRPGDLAARTGGDEFVILQRGLRHRDEAEPFARRVARALSEPYEIEERPISIGASVGYVVSACDDPLADLVARADNALYAIKQLGGGAAAHSDMNIGKASIIADGGLR